MKTTAVARVREAISGAVSAIRMTSPPMLLGRKLLKKVATRNELTRCPIEQSTLLRRDQHAPAPGADGDHACRRRRARPPSSADPSTASACADGREVGLTEEQDQEAQADGDLDERERSSGRRCARTGGKAAGTSPEGGAESHGDPRAATVEQRNIRVSGADNPRSLSTFDRAGSPVAIIPAGRPHPRRTGVRRWTRPAVLSVPQLTRGLGPRRRASHSVIPAIPSLRILMLAPEPFFEPRGTPFSEYHRIKALVEQGHHVDLVTYPIGADVDLPNLRIIRSVADAVRRRRCRSARRRPSWSWTCCWS